MAQWASVCVCGALSIRIIYHRVVYETPFACRNCARWNLSDPRCGFVIYALCIEWNTKWMHWKVRVDRFWIPHQIARLRVYTRLLHRTQDCFRLNEIVAHFVMHWFRACVSIPSIDYSMGCAPSEAIPTFSVRKIFTIIICRSDLARQTRELYITGWSE